MRIYCCGGAGGNIGKQLIKTHKNADVCFIDTSDSNLRGVDANNVYLVDDMDGAGKQRSKTYEAFSGLTEEVLIQFKPSTSLNVVISSLSGGSGSIISPLVTKALIENDSPVIVIAIESRGSIIEINNTINTLKTFQSISEKLQRSICLRYVENNKRGVADEDAVNLVEALIRITDRDLVSEFDTADIHNFINFDRVTDNDPTVSILEINPNSPDVTRKGVNYVSTILISTDKEATIQDPDSRPDYLASCLALEESYFTQDMRLDNVTGSLVMIVDDLQKEMQALKERRTINKVKTLEVEGSNDDGIVL